MFDALTNLLQRIEPEAFLGMMIPISAILGTMLVGIIALIVRHIQHSRQRELDASLKHEMIARGMSADEIERVLAAKTGPAEAK